MATDEEKHQDFSNKRGHKRKWSALNDSSLDELMPENQNTITGDFEAFGTALSEFKASTSNDDSYELKWKSLLKDLKLLQATNENIYLKLLNKYGKMKDELVAVYNKLDILEDAGLITICRTMVEQSINNMMKVYIRDVGVLLEKSGCISSYKFGDTIAIQHLKATDNMIVNYVDKAKIKSDSKTHKDYIRKFRIVLQLFRKDDEQTIEKKFGGNKKKFLLSLLPYYIANNKNCPLSNYKNEIMNKLCIDENKFEECEHHIMSGQGNMGTIYSKLSEDLHDAEYLDGIHNAVITVKKSFSIDVDVFLTWIFSVYGYELEFEAEEPNNKKSKLF